MNDNVYNTLTKGEKFIHDWQYNILGDFKMALIKAITLSDQHNREKLRLGFPEEVKAYENYHTKQGWWDNLCKKLEIDV